MKPMLKMGLLLVAALIITAPQKTMAQVTVKLTILRVRQLDKVDGTEPGDFYARVLMGSTSFPPTSFRVNDADVSPGWVFTESTTRNSPLSINIQILDKDDRSSNNPDDICDVSPADGKKILSIAYHPNNRTISGEVSGRERETLYARGVGDGNRVEIWFQVTEAEAPPPPAVGIHRENVAPPESCGSCTSYHSSGQYERATPVTVACPRIRAVEPAETHPGQWLVILGDWFGDFADRIEPCFPQAEKRVMLLRFQEESRDPNPTPIRLAVSEWSDHRILVKIPGNIAPGRYRLCIFYPQVPGRDLSFGQVGNMMTVSVGRR